MLLQPSGTQEAVVDIVVVATNMAAYCNKMSLGGIAECLVEA